MGDRKEILIAKYVSNNISDKEKEELKQLLNESTANPNELQQTEKLWNVSANLKIQSNNDVENAWDEFRLLAESSPKKNSLTNGFFVLKMAAAIALFVVTSLVVKFFISKPDFNPVPVAPKATVAMMVISTGDSARKIILPDSTVVLLNKNSRFIYPEIFDRRERITFLTGEAFFNVTHRANAFVVFCGKTRTKVLGTSFNIKGYETDKEVEVTVVTGKVELSRKQIAGSEKIILSKNDRGSFNKEENSLTKDSLAKAKIILIKNDRGAFNKKENSLTKSKIVETKKLKWWQKSKLIQKISNFFSKTKNK